jgi:hypothetical protein
MADARKFQVLIICRIVRIFSTRGVEKQHSENSEVKIFNGKSPVFDNKMNQVTRSQKTEVRRNQPLLKSLNTSKHVLCICRPQTCNDAF